MAMTIDDAAVPEDDLDGHTMEELGAYLDRGRTPRDAAIESSPACRLALSGMQRLRELSWDAMQRRADEEPDRDSVWISGLLDTIRSEVRSGRDVPVEHPDPRLRLTITEAAVRGLVRRTGDTMGGLVMGRCTLDGDVGVPGAPIRVEVTASIAYGLVAETTADQLRARIEDALARHTDLVIDRIDVVFDDVHVP
ncbi:hypothetical protein ACLBWP_13525 [Microbacterium sp. M1A1_1b]|uniref:hypothetical protein n=1 Tax=Curtobacterium sp. VKM Ac-2922 TaxID=2929475 RepID=UPI001FB3FA54|nr:hypothetical protein [Curtobacterium sp. VKM Ac-2922]MCJ1712858.1 hypothetical protein [Curtobacterium sp. VKM Ac-2922]